MNEKSIDIPIRIWLRDAAEQLAHIGIGSALLDAEIILAHTLRKSRTWLHAHDDETIPLRQLEIANARLELRLDRTPIAYIVGHKWFYGRLFKVTPATLIPRPESEELIALLAAHRTPAMKTLIDVGTGSGCLGITAKLEYPELTVTLSDISRHALTVAQANATNLGADVTILRSDLLTAAPQRYDIIVANLPYVDREWERSPETNHEPDLALFADDGGLRLIRRLIDEVALQLAPGGLLILEADPCQHETITTTASRHGLEYVEAKGYGVAFRKPYPS